jgi:hypothetical protein
MPTSARASSSDRSHASETNVRNDLWLIGSAYVAGLHTRYGSASMAPMEDQHINFQGSRLLVPERGSFPDLRQFGWNDTASSLSYMWV